MSVYLFVRWISQKLLNRFTRNSKGECSLGHLFPDLTPCWVQHRIWSAGTACCPAAQCETTTFSCRPHLLHNILFTLTVDASVHEEQLALCYLLQGRRGRAQAVNKPYLYGCRCDSNQVFKERRGAQMSQSDWRDAQWDVKLGSISILSSNCFPGLTSLDRNVSRFESLSRGLPWTSNTSCWTSPANDSGGIGFIFLVPCLSFGRCQQLSETSGTFVLIRFKRPCFATSPSPERLCLCLLTWENKQVKTFKHKV